MERLKSGCVHPIYRVVLTGGPCGGKTTCQSRLTDFFEGLGWKVYRPPETATLLLGGGVKWSEMTPVQAAQFQKHLLLTMLQIEETFFTLAEGHVDKPVLVICDRGALDASAFVPKEEWEEILSEIGRTNVELRDQRYQHVIHVVSASHGAEEFYQTENNSTRKEGLELARHLDQRAQEAWVGHPYFDVIDNSTDFEHKIRRVIECVCNRVGVDYQDRLGAGSKKRRFVVKGVPKDIPVKLSTFEVVHKYLMTSDSSQARIRMRTQDGHSSYTYTTRRTLGSGERIETRLNVSLREYQALESQADPMHHTVFKTRHCFLWHDQYFQLDIYKEPCNDRCKGLVFLEFFSSKAEPEFPDFLEVVREVTSVPEFSMYNLSRAEESLSS